MANVLGELFRDIADAIRGKTGGTETMKPAEFPDAISGIDQGPTIITDLTIEPDFSAGDHEVPAYEGYAVQGATIKKPETLIPENIAEGIDIAGVIGTLVAGGGGDSKAVFAAGSFKPTTTGKQTIEHGLGVVPDFVFVWSYAPHGTTSYIQGTYCVSSAFYEKCPVENTMFLHNVNGASLTNAHNTLTMAQTQSIYGSIYATADTFEVGSTGLYLQPQKNCFWFAMGGLT